jgi:hypothetical protein
VLAFNTAASGKISLILAKQRLHDFKQTREQTLKKKQISYPNVVNVVLESRVHAYEETSLLIASLPRLKKN